MIISSSSYPTRHRKSKWSGKGSNEQIWTNRMRLTLWVSHLQFNSDAFVNICKFYPFQTIDGVSYERFTGQFNTNCGEKFAVLSLLLLVGTVNATFTGEDGRKPDRARSDTQAGGSCSGRSAQPSPLSGKKWNCALVVCPRDLFDAKHPADRNHHGAEARKPLLRSSDGAFGTLWN